MAESNIPNLKRLRTERFLTQVQLAAALNKAPRTIIRWESGDGEPGIQELQVLARFFKVSVDQLLSDLVGNAKADTVIMVSALEGRMLDYWVARLEGIDAELIDGDAVFYEAGVGQRSVLDYSADPAAAYPVIVARRIHLTPSGHGKFDGAKLTSNGWLARCDGSSHTMQGPTFLIAAMRAAIASVMGTELVG